MGKKFDRVDRIAGFENSKCQAPNYKQIPNPKSQITYINPDPL
jgi:hypothetical protein